MKKLLFTLLLCVPFLAQAATDDSKYLKGAVPEENGIVTFRQTFTVPGKQQADIYTTMKAYAKTLVDGSIPNSLRARIVSEDAATGEIVMRAEEYMVFKRKPLYLDRAQFRYTLSITCTPDGKVQLKLNTITYGYEEDSEGNTQTTLKAEEWITDAHAINKAGTKLYPRSGKFRRKTVDRVAEIFLNARQAFEEPEQPVAKKPAATVVE